MNKILSFFLPERLRDLVWRVLGVYLILVCIGFLSGVYYPNLVYEESWLAFVDDLYWIYFVILVLGYIYQIVYVKYIKK